MTWPPTQENKPYGGFYSVSITITLHFKVCGKFDEKTIV